MPCLPVSHSAGQVHQEWWILGWSASNKAPAIGFRGICSFCGKVVYNCYLMARLLSNPSLMPGYSCFDYHHEQILHLLENEVTMKSGNTPLVVSDNACSGCIPRGLTPLNFAPRRAIASSSSRVRSGVDVTSRNSGLRQRLDPIPSRLQNA
jgi:hypothetical protein